MNRSGIHWLSRLCLGLLLLHLLSSVSSAQDDANLKARFMREAPSAWKAYQTFSKKIQASWTLTGRAKKNGTALGKQQMRFEYKNSENGALNTRITVAGGTDGEATGVNSAYLFRLKRKSAWQGWLVVEVERAHDSLNWPTLEKKAREAVLKETCSGIQLYTLWLPDLVKDKNFKINSVRTQRQDGVALVRVDFDYVKDKKSFSIAGALPIRSGWMLLDPGHDWVLREFELTFLASPPDYGRVHRTLEIKEGTGKHPIVIGTHSKQEGRDGEDTGETIWDAEAEVAEGGDIPVADFRLSAFGLPEPGTVVVGSGWSYYLWFAGAGVLALLLGQLLRNRAKRRREEELAT